MVRRRPAGHQDGWNREFEVTSPTRTLHSYGWYSAGGQVTLANGYGPYDYRSPEEPNAIEFVESFHFTENVESQKRRQSETVPQDFEYTLCVFPNHPRALNAVARYEIAGMERRASSGPLRSAAECWFLRAVAWRPQDAAVRTVYANYLQKCREFAQADVQYRAALELAPRSPEIHYNYGLLLVEMDRRKESVEQARLAYASGYPSTGSRNKLRKVGVELAELSRRKSVGSVNEK